MKKILFRVIFPIVVMFIGISTIKDIFNTPGDTSNPDSQLELMLPAEREFCEKILWKIDSSSNERDVLALLGRPSRSLKLKKNWWVELDGKKDRVGVYFNTSGLATAIALDGGTGRFYYRRDVVITK